MLSNYLKVAVRSILRNKLTSFINIAGLAIAMACCLLIFLFIRDEFSYDRYHAKADRIYRVTREFLSPNGTTTLHLGHVAPPFGPLLKNDFPDFEYVARIHQNRFLVTIQENTEEKRAFNEDNVFFAEPELFRIFDIGQVEGNQEKELQKPNTLMMSAKTARRYFGEESAQGKRLLLNNKLEMEVTGVFADFPPQSHWHPDFLVSFSTLYDSTVYGRKRLDTNWGGNSFATYILVKDQPFDARKLSAQFPAFLDKHMGPDMGKNTAIPSTWTKLYLQPLNAIHLRSQLDSEIEANGNINNVYMMGVIGIFIILIACFNFINLSTAQATKRSKEVGLRKVVGAFRVQLISQYLSESLITSAAALIVGLLITSFALDWLNHFTGKALHLDFSQGSLLLGMIAFAAAVGILAGAYPALMVSGYKPALVLKGQLGSSKGKGGIRKTLVVTQFAISIALMISTAITFQQLNFLNTRELGYSKDQLITVPYNSELAADYPSFYHELTKHSSIHNAARSTLIPTDRLTNYDDAKVQAGDAMAATSVVVKNVDVDHEFFETYQIPLVAGRNFSRDIKSDDSLAFVLNEAAVKMIGWKVEDAPGKEFQYGDTRGKIIGVVKDFHFESLHEPIVPVVFFLTKYYSRVAVRIDGKNMAPGLSHVESVWKKFVPKRPFEFQFLNERYHQLYDSEQKQSQLFTLFSGLAIFIACLGLFGLATFSTLQRVKEIGIRKVMGASMAQILGLLSKEIVILVLVASLLAWPLAWYFMQQWLNTFAYRIDVPLYIFILSAAGAILLALVTVSSQTIRTAMTNPSKTLRYE